MFTAAQCCVVRDVPLFAPQEAFYTASRRRKFPLIDKLLDVLLALPPCNIAAERMFSRLESVRSNKRRSRYSLHNVTTNMSAWYKNFNPTSGVLEDPPFPPRSRDKLLLASSSPFAVQPPSDDSSDDSEPDSDDDDDSDVYSDGYAPRVPPAARAARAAARAAGADGVSAAGTAPSSSKKRAALRTAAGASTAALASKRRRR